jgi:phage terminase small subunit
MDQELALKDTKKTTDLVTLHNTFIGEVAEGEDNPLVGLTGKQLRFVEAYAALAGSHGALSSAARYAGYAEVGVRSKGSILIRMPKILAALRYLTEHKAHASSILAISTLENLMMTGNDSIRLKASERILGYAGIIVKAVHTHEHLIQDNRTPEQIKASIKEKAEKMGIMVDITPEKKPSNNPAGKPRTKVVLLPNRPLSDDEMDSLDDLDWANLSVTKK